MQSLSLQTNWENVVISEMICKCICPNARWTGQNQNRCLKFSGTALQLQQGSSWAVTSTNRKSVRSNKYISTIESFTLQGSSKSCWPSMSSSLNIRTLSYWVTVPCVCGFVSTVEEEIIDSVDNGIGEGMGCWSVTGKSGRAWVKSRVTARPSVPKSEWGHLQSPLSWL